MARLPAVAAVTAEPAVGGAAPFNSLRRTKVREAPIALAAPLGCGAAIAFRLDGDGRFGRLGRFPLHSTRPPGRVQDFE
jgi:hypothetical protein